MLSNEFNYFEFIKYCLYHKVLVLCWKNIRSIIPDKIWPKYLNDIIRYSYIITKKRNKAYLLESNQLIKKAKENGIAILPVKGTYLVSNLYSDLGIRYMGDNDFLVQHKDLNQLTILLKKSGFKTGHYNEKTNEIDDLTRAEEIKWKLYASTLPPYYKLTNREDFATYQMDFRYSLSDNLDYEPVNEIMQYYVKYKKS